MGQAITLKTLGIDFGFAVEGESLGYSQFETRLHEGSATITVINESLTSTLADFTKNILHSEIAQQSALLTLDAPITPVLIPALPAVGRQVEHRFSRGRFSNGLRGPQPSSIRVPRQGWPLYCEAMRFLVAINQAGFSLPTFPEMGHQITLDFRTKMCVEVCPKLTQTLFTPTDRISTRSPSNGQPVFYRQIDNWLFPHLFVKQQPMMPYPDGGLQPAFGQDSGSIAYLLGDEVAIDASVWAEAARIQAIQPLSLRHELIGAFVAGIQGAMMIAGKASMFGAPGEHEGFYILPSTWHEDWSNVWHQTARPDDCVRKVDVEIIAGNDDVDVVGMDGGQ
jgi:hypothetical protein